MDTIQAVRNDISTTVKIAKVCFGELGFGACLCNIFLVLKPAWMDNLPTPQMRCSGGDIFGLLVNKILVLIAQTLDNAVNINLILPMNVILRWFGAKIPYLCTSRSLGDPTPLCVEVEDGQKAFASMGCYDFEDAPQYAQKQCFFKRQRAICLDDGGRYNRYEDLFNAPNIYELQDQYKEIVGDSFEVLDPTFKSLMEQVSGQHRDVDVIRATELCDQSLYESMDLDEIIIVCIFKFIEGFCPSSDSSERFQTFLKDEGVWHLPSVVYDWKAAPPPPPPASLKGPIAQLALYDPEGWAQGEKILDDYFPRLNHVLSKQAGSIINNKYGPKYFVNKYEASIAFLSTEHFDDANSISARMTQARFTGYGIFSCMALKDFMSDPSNAAAGTKAPTESRQNNPENYNSAFDRNWLIIFASIYTESLVKETGVRQQAINPMSWWGEQCEEPMSYRTPVLPSMWRADPTIMAPVDAVGNIVTARDLSPLVGYGPLRQFRDFKEPLSYAENSMIFIIGKERMLRGSLASYGRDRRNLLVIAPGSGFGDAYAELEAMAKGSESNAHELVTDPVAKLTTSYNGGKEKRTRIPKSDGRAQTRGSLDSETPSATPSPIQNALSNIATHNLGLSFTSGTGVDFKRDYEEMRSPLTSAMAQKVFCNPTYSLTIEELVGDPPPFTERDDTYDTSIPSIPKNLVAPGMFKGNGNFAKRYSQHMSDSGEVLSYNEQSTQRWVYLTSSDDPSVAPGWHRLAELRAFPDVDCDDMQEQLCGFQRQSGSGSSSSFVAMDQVSRTIGALGDYAPSAVPMGDVPMANRRKLQDYADDSLDKSIAFYFTNRLEPGATPNLHLPQTTFKTGIESLLSARCSDYLYENNVPYAKKCTNSGEPSTAWYRERASDGCTEERLEIIPIAEYNNVAAYLPRFKPPTPPPRPPPSQPPPKPPEIPAPSPPPSPPRFESREMALEFSTTMMENFCDRCASFYSHSYHPIPPPCSPCVLCRTAASTFCRPNLGARPLRLNSTYNLRWTGSRGNLRAFHRSRRRPSRRRRRPRRPLLNRPPPRRG